MNEYKEAERVQEEMMTVINRTDLTDLQRLNFLRTVEISAKLLHTSIVNKILKEKYG